MSVTMFTDSNFEDEVLKVQDKPVLVDFWAPWCGPCRIVGPVIEALAQEQTDIVIGKLNVDENPITASKYAVMSIPTLIIFNKGEQADKLIGAQPKEVIESHIRKALNG